MLLLPPKKVKNCLSRMSGKLSCTVLRRGKGSNPFSLVDYRWPEWIQIMEEANLTRSMSKKGCSPDNSACEGFFGHLKTEMFYGHDWDEYSIEEFIHEVNRYMGWYCKDRIKSTLGGLSPLDYRRSIGIAV